MAEAEWLRERRTLDAKRLEVLRVQPHLITESMGRAWSSAVIAMVPRPARHPRDRRIGHVTTMSLGSKPVSGPDNDVLSWPPRRRAGGGGCSGQCGGAIAAMLRYITSIDLRISPLGLNCRFSQSSSASGAWPGAM